jgi:DNA repair exonuclease SbcCD ATPase subunit
VERRCRDYYHEIRNLSARNIGLQKELEKANGLLNAADCKAKELDAVSTHLAERNVSLEQDLDRALERNESLRQDLNEAHERIKSMELSSCEVVRGNLVLQRDLYEAHEKIHNLENQVVRADPPSADASGSENKAQGLGAVAENQVKQFEDGENRDDNRETGSTISVVSNIASLSPRGQNGEGNKPGYGKRKQHKRAKHRAKV